MFPAILLLKEKPTIWFDQQNKLTDFYMCPKNTETPTLPRDIDSKWVKLKEKRRELQSLCSVNFLLLWCFLNKTIMFQKAFTKATRASRFPFFNIHLKLWERGVFFIFWETIAKIFGAIKIWFLYHTSLFLGLYYIVPGEFLGFM